MQLYHYTTIEAFNNIIKRNELWLSERNHMNDVYDETYIQDLVKKELNPDNKINFKNSYFDRNFTPDIPQYVFSTTTEKDAAHQWLSYGNANAICIELDEEKLVEYFKGYLKSKYPSDEIDYPNPYFHFDAFLHSSKVIYEKDDVERKVKQFVSNYKNELLKELENLTGSSTSDQYGVAKKDFYQFYSCVKQDKFYAENEYRFLIYSKKEPESRIRGNRLVPYMNISIKNEKLPITGIIISPYNKDKSYENTIRLFLNKNGYDNVSVFPSEIYLR